MHGHSHTPRFSRWSPEEILMATIVSLVLGGVVYYMMFFAPVR